MSWIKDLNRMRWNRNEVNVGGQKFIENAQNSQPIHKPDLQQNHHRKQFRTKTYHDTKELNHTTISTHIITSKNINRDTKIQTSIIAPTLSERQIMWKKNKPQPSNHPQTVTTSNSKSNSHYSKKPIPSFLYDPESTSAKSSDS